MSDPTAAQRAYQIAGCTGGCWRCQENIKIAIQEAESSARKKALEEVVYLCETTERAARDFCSTQPHGSQECTRANTRAHTAHMIAESVRALTEKPINAE